MHRHTEAVMANLLSAKRKVGSLAFPYLEHCIHIPTRGTTHTYIVMASLQLSPA